MYSRLATSTLLLCLISPSFAHAADEAGNYAIWGVGRASCHQYLKAAKNPDDKRFKIYLMGYLTAFNTLQQNTYNATGDRKLDDVLSGLAEYCGDHQMDSYDRAIQQLLAVSFETRHQMPPGQARGWGRAAPPKTPESKNSGPQLSPP